MTKEPLAGVKFRVTYADGSYVDQDGGKTSSNGIYITDTTGQIKILGIVGTVVVEEIETIPGYYIDPNSKSQTVQINANDTQTLTFTNAPTQSLVVQKFEAGTKDQPLAGVEFLLTDSSGAPIGPDDGVYKTDAQGRITITGLIPGSVITAREVKTLEGYVLDGTPQSREIKSGDVQTLTFYNEKAGTLVIEKKDSVSGALIPGARFQLSYATGGFVDTDNGHLSSNGLYETDANGEIRIFGITGTVVCKEVQAAPGYVIDSSTQAYRELSRETRAYPFPQQPVPQNTERQPLSLEQRHAAYTTMLNHLTLLGKHRENLLGRGLSMERIERNQYRSMPETDRSRRLLAELLRSSGHELLGLPGFRTYYGAWSISGPTGFLIPVRNKDGLIQGLKIRLDGGEANRKYRWLSSRNLPNGTRSYSWVHVTGDTASKRAYLTEGPLKGDAASFLANDALFVCIGGVNATNGLKDTLIDLGVREVVEAMDMDQLTNENVRKAVLAMRREVQTIPGVKYYKYTWDPAYKGVDDYLLSRRTMAL